MTDPLHAARVHRDEQKAALMRALCGLTPDVEEPAGSSGAAPDEAPRTPSFDGGARRDQPAPAETHEQWLVRVLSEAPRGSRGTFG